MRYAFYDVVLVPWYAQHRDNVSVVAIASPWPMDSTSLITIEEDLQLVQARYRPVYS